MQIHYTAYDILLSNVNLIGEFLFMVNLKVKQAILNWLIENSNQWNTTAICKEAFNQYIHDANGIYLIGGQEVEKFIDDANALIFGDLFN